MDLSELSIIGIAADTNGCGYYRLINPLAALEKEGAHCYIGAATMPPIKDLWEFKIIILQRPIDSALVDIIRDLKNSGHLVIIDTDDMLEDIPEDNPASEFYTEEKLTIYKKCLSAASGITVSTPELVRAYSQYNYVKVIPNYIDFSLRNFRQNTYTDRINIGWTASTSHMADISAIGPVLKNIMDRYQNINYVHYGDKAVMETLIKSYEIEQSRIKFIPWTSFVFYPENLSQIDIGIAPLVNNAFNRAKSPIKVLEYGAKGIPSAASKVAPYARAGIGIVSDDLEGSLSTLIEDKELRVQIGNESRAAVLKDYALENNLYTYIDVWADLMNGKTDRYKLPSRNSTCPCGSGIKYKNCCSPAFG